MYFVPAPVEFVTGADPSFHVNDGFNEVIYVNLFAVFQFALAAERLGDHHLKLAANPVHQTPVIVQCGGVERRIALLHGFLTDDAPTGLVVVGPKIPLVIDECLRLARLQGIAILIDMNKRTLAEFWVIWQVHPCLLQKVVSKEALGVLYVSLDCLEVQLCAVL